MRGTEALVAQRVACTTRRTARAGRAENEEEERGDESKGAHIAEAKSIGGYM